MREFILSAMRRANRMNEEQLRSLLYSFGEEYSLFVAMMDSLDDGLILLDKNNFIVKANRAAERILGTRLTDIQEIKLWDCIDCQKISEFIQRVIKNEETKKNETFVLNSTSVDIKYVEVSILPLVFKKKNYRYDCCVERRYKRKTLGDKTPTFRKSREFNKRCSEHCTRN